MKSMQEKNPNKVKKILLELSFYLNVKGIQGVAEYFGENRDKFYSWIKNGNIPDTGFILAKHPEISNEWLRTGKGTMTVDVSRLKDRIVSNLTNRTDHSAQSKAGHNDGSTVKDILSKLCSHFNVKGLRNLADFLGESETRIYAWVRNKKISDFGPILAKDPSINIEWLKTGKGLMIVDVIPTTQRIISNFTNISDRLGQEKKSEEIKQRLVCLAKHVNANNISRLARYLEQSNSKLYSWIYNGNIADTGCVLAKVPEININWLKTGAGPMTVSVPPPSGQIVSILTGSANHSGQGDPDPASEDFNIDDIVSMTRDVLASDTVYRTALVGVTRALHKSVTTEDEMKGLEKKIDLMQTQNEEISARMERMEQMLLSLGASVPKKRETGS